MFNALLNSWGFIRHLAPYMIGGILLAAVLKTFVPRHKPAKLLRAKKWWILPAAAVTGIVSPACTYGAAPLFMEMIKSGAPMAPAATFLVSSAMVNPQMFLLTAGALGIPVAIAQTAASLVFAILIGLLVSWTTSRGIDLEGSELRAARRTENDRQLRRHRKHDAIKKRSWPRELGIDIIDLAEFVGFYFVMGTVIAALVSEFVPRGVVIGAVGQGKWWAIPFAAVISIPTYVCGGGIIPFLAKAQEMGMAMGAILAFLIAGPATRITALAALMVLFKKRAVLVYVLLLLVFSMLLGTALGSLVQITRPSVRF